MHLRCCLELFLIRFEVAFGAMAMVLLFSSLLFQISSRFIRKDRVFISYYQIFLRKFYALNDFSWLELLNCKKQSHDFLYDQLR